MFRRRGGYPGWGDGPGQVVESSEPDREPEIETPEPETVVDIQVKEPELKLRSRKIAEVQGTPEPCLKNLIR